MQYRIATEGYYGDPKTARVKTYDEVALEYAYHPESKCADAEGTFVKGDNRAATAPARLGGSTKHIGKESNSLEDVEEGLIHAEDNVYTLYPDPRRDEWQVKILPALKKARLADLVAETGMSKRALLDLRAGRSKPRAKNLKAVMRALRKLELI